MSKLERDISELLKNTKSGEFTIFYVDNCPYCLSAIKLLKDNKLHFKGYDIAKYGLKKLLNVFRKFASDNHISFNINHTTKPLIFVGGKFLGGYTELQTYI